MEQQQIILSICKDHNVPMQYYCKFCQKCLCKTCLNHKRHKSHISIDIQQTFQESQLQNVLNYENNLKTKQVIEDYRIDMFNRFDIFESEISNKLNNLRKKVKNYYEMDILKFQQFEQICQLLKLNKLNVDENLVKEVLQNQQRQTQLDSINMEQFDELRNGLLEFLKTMDSYDFQKKNVYNFQNNKEPITKLQIDKNLMLTSSLDQQLNIYKLQANNQLQEDTLYANNLPILNSYIFKENKILFNDLKNLKIFDYNLEMITQQKETENKINAIDFHQDFIYVALSNKKFFIYQYLQDDNSLSEFYKVSLLKKSDIYEIKMFQNGQRMLIFTSKMKIKIYDMMKNRLKKQVKSQSFKELITNYVQMQNQIAIGNSFLLIGMNKDSILQISLETLKIMQNFLVFDNRVSSLLISQNNDIFVSGHQNGLITFWDAKKGEQLETIQYTNQLIRSLDIQGQNLWFTSDDNKIYRHQNTLII